MLGQASHRRVDRREHLGQVAHGAAAHRVQHGPAQKTALDFAARTHPVANRQGLLLRRIKAEETQRANVAAVVDRHDQLAPWPKAHFALGDHRFDLYGVTLARLAELADVGFVLVAQRQVQRQVDIAHQPELGQSLLHRAFGRGTGFGGRGGGRTVRHGPIVPRVSLLNCLGCGPRLGAQYSPRTTHAMPMNHPAHAAPVAPVLSGAGRTHAQRSGAQ